MTISPSRMYCKTREIVIDYLNKNNILLSRTRISGHSTLVGRIDLVGETESRRLKASSFCPEGRLPYKVMRNPSCLPPSLWALPPIPRSSLRRAGASPPNGSPPPLSRRRLAPPFLTTLIKAKQLYQFSSLNTVQTPLPSLPK